MAEMEKQGSALAGVTLEGSDFASLLKKEFKPKTDEAKSAVEQAVQTLAQQALANTALRSTDAVRTIEAMIAALDKRLTEQINLIIHHEDFQKLESAWRGLHYLVNNTETDEQLKIRVMNVSKQDLGKTLKRYKGTAWDQSPLFKKLYEEEYGQFGGEPYGALVGDYHFDHTPPDVELLGEMSKLAASAHAPFITGASPSVMQMESWQELANPRDLTKIFTTPEYAAWRSLRESDDARYLAMCMPRFLARLPYGAKTSPVDEFDFEEDTAGATHAKYSWANAAYAMAVNINRSSKSYGWCSRIRGSDSGRAPAVPVRLQPLRALPEVHRPRQGRLLPLARGDAELAERVDPELRRRRPCQLGRGDQGQAAARRGAGRSRGNRRRAGVLPVEVLPETALPARRPDGVFAPGLQATVG